MANEIPFPSSLFPGYESPNAAALQQAQTAGVQAQTQGTQLTNQTRAFNLSLLQSLLSNPDSSAAASTGPQADEFGSAPPANEPASSAAVGGGISPPGLDTSKAQSLLAQRFQPLPMIPTPQELQMIKIGAVTGNADLMNGAKTSMQLRTDAVNAQRSIDARSAYDGATSVAQSDPGTAWQVLSRYHPDQAAAMKKAADAQGLTADQLDQEVRQRATVVAGHVHDIAQLPYKVEEGNILDAVTGLPITGHTEVLAMKAAEVAKNATEQRGQDISAATQRRGQNIGAIEAGKDEAGNPTITNKLTGSVAMASRPDDAAASATRTTPTASAGIAPKILPGVDLTQLPQAPPPTSGYQNKSQAADTTATGTRKNAIIASSAADVAKAAADNALLSQAQSKLNSINPRAVGPGSSAYKTMLEMKTAISGKAPNDLVDMGIVAKLSSQLGMQNAQQLLKGMRITNNEMMTVLNLASANPNQPLGVMKAIIAFQKANSEYTGLAGQTTVRGIRAGADPDQIAGGIETQSPRSTYVENRVTEMVNPAPAGALAILAQNPQFEGRFKTKYGYIPTGQR